MMNFLNGVFIFVLVIGGLFVAMKVLDAVIENVVRPLIPVAIGCAVIYGVFVLFFRSSK